MSEKLYVITYHTEDSLRTNSKRTFKKTAKSIADILDELEKFWYKMTPSQCVVIDFIYSEEYK